MYTFLIQLRLKQLYRILAEVGIGMLLVLAFIVGLCSLSLMASLSKTEHWAWAFLCTVPALSIHFSRKDKKYLSHISAQNVTLIFAVEYLCTAIPLAILLSFFQTFQTVLLGVLLSIFVAFLPILDLKSKKTPFLTYNFIPLYLYEWRLGFRKDGIGAAFFTVNFLALLGVQLEGSILVFSLLSSFLFVNIYNFCEPKEWLEIPFSLWKKIKLHLLVWTLILFPQAVLFCIFYAELWYFTVIAWYFTAMSIAFCLAYKYSVWSPVRYEVGISMPASLFIGMMLVVFTSPACIFAIYYYWKKVRT